MPHLPQQHWAALKAAIAADPVLSLLPHTTDDAVAVATAFNLVASPDYWVWRTFVTEEEITAKPSVDGTVWSWSAYIARSQGERDGWDRIMGRGINPSLTQDRSAVADIFSGSANSAPAQRTHLNAVGRRKALRIEKLLIVAGGLGTTASPSTMQFEGQIDGDDVQRAWELP